jgi:putative transposase
VSDGGNGSLGKNHHTMTSAFRLSESANRMRDAAETALCAGVAQGRRTDLQGGGLIRSLGGWQAVQALRRGREAYRADERLLGRSAFVEAVLQERT